MYKLYIPLGQTEPKYVSFQNGDLTTFVPFDPANTDYQAYLKYIEQGGLVLPADAGAGTEEVTPE